MGDKNVGLNKSFQSPVFFTENEIGKKTKNVSSKDFFSNEFVRLTTLINAGKACKIYFNKQQGIQVRKRSNGFIEFCRVIFLVNFFQYTLRGFSDSNKRLLAGIKKTIDSSEAFLKKSSSRDITNLTLQTLKKVSEVAIESLIKKNKNRKKTKESYILLKNRISKLVELYSCLPIPLFNCNMKCTPNLKKTNVFPKAPSSSETPKKDKENISKLGKKKVRPINLKNFKGVNNKSINVSSKGNSKYGDFSAQIAYIKKISRAQTNLRRNFDEPNKEHQTAIDLREIPSKPVEESAHTVLSKPLIEEAAHEKPLQEISLKPLKEDIQTIPSCEEYLIPMIKINEEKIKDPFFKNLTLKNLHFRNYENIQSNFTIFVNALRQMERIESQIQEFESKNAPEKVLPVNNNNSQPSVPPPPPGPPPPMQKNNGPKVNWKDKLKEELKDVDRSKEALVTGSYLEQKVLLDSSYEEIVSILFPGIKNVKLTPFELNDYIEAFKAQTEEELRKIEEILNVLNPLKKGKVEKKDGEKINLFDGLDEKVVKHIKKLRLLVKQIRLNLKSFEVSNNKKNDIEIDCKKHINKNNLLSKEILAIRNNEKSLELDQKIESFNMTESAIKENKKEIANIQIRLQRLQMLIDKYSLELVQALELEEPCDMETLIQLAEQKIEVLFSEKMKNG